MKKTAAVMFTWTLFAAPASGITLNELIRQNVEDAAVDYKKALPPTQQPIQLWVHIRSDSQKALAREILNRLTSAESTPWKIERKPIQQVSAGPRKSQLRYFKKTDQAQAHELFTLLRREIPQLELADLSRQYESLIWIRPGHYELWLGADLQRLAPR